MKEITKAQEEILQVLWDIKEGTANDVLDILPSPKPAYNTVSTVIRVLEKKGYVGHKAYGKTHVYYPQVSRKDYVHYHFKDSLKEFFNNSLQQAFSFFAKQKKELSLSELEELKRLIEQEINNKKEQ